MKWISALAFLCVSASAALAQPAAPAPAAPPAHIYGVMFEVTANKAGKVDTIEVVQVIDTQSRQPAPEMIAQVPKAYIAATRELFQSQTYGPGEHFYTSNFFDPQRPNEAVIDLPSPK